MFFLMNIKERKHLSDIMYYEPCQLTVSFEVFKHLGIVNVTALEKK